MERSIVICILVICIVIMREGGILLLMLCLGGGCFAVSLCFLVGERPCDSPGYQNAAEAGNNPSLSAIIICFMWVVGRVGWGCFYFILLCPYAF